MGRSHHQTIAVIDLQTDTDNVEPEYLYGGTK